MIISVTNEWNNILTTTKYTIIKAEVNDVYITTGDDIEGIRLEQGKTFLIGAGFTVKARSYLNGSKLSYLESEYPVSVTGGTGGGGSGTSDTTETTQLLVKTAVQNINTKTDTVLTNIGDISSSPATADSGLFSINSLIKRGLQNWTTLQAKLPPLISGRIPVDGSGTTQPVSATTLPLPTGASSSALQTTGNTSLNNIDNKLPTIGQKTIANSVSVALASDQSFPLANGASTSALQTTGNTSLNNINTKLPALGQTTLANSVSVALASDQVFPLASGASTSALQTTGNTSLANIDNKLPTIGQKTLANSVSVVLASDQTFPLANGASTATLQTTGNTSLSSIDTKFSNIGAIADGVATTDTGSFSVISFIKRGLQNWTTLQGKLPTLVSGRIPVDNSGVTQPVSATTLPLPTGASTAALQTTGNTSLASVDTKLSNVGAVADVIASSDTGSFSIISLIKRGLQNWTTLQAKLPSLISGRIPVDNSGVTQPVSATSLPLPTGASTSALQTTGNTSLASLDSKLPVLGQTTLANSVSVVLASDQSFPLASGASTSALQTTGNTSLANIDTKIPASISGRIPVDNSGVTQPVSAATLPLPTGASTATLQTTGNTSLNNIDTKLPTIGQKTIANSVSVALASDQVFPLANGASTSALQTTGNTSLANIDTKIPASISGRIPVDNSGVTQPVSATSLPLPTGASTAALQTTGNTSLGNIDTKFSNIGAVADAVATTDTGSFSIIALIKRGLQNWTTLHTKIPSLVSGRIPVDGSGTTQPVSATSLPLPTGASTAALQTTGNTSLGNIDTKIPASVSGRIPVDNSGVIQPVSATALPLPAGASTSDLQTTGNTSLNNINTKLPALGQTTLANSVSVALASDQVFPLANGASTSALQTTGNTSLNNIDTKFSNVGAIADVTATTDSGSFSIISLIKRGLQNWTTLQGKLPALISGRIPVDSSGVTQPVSAVALPLPTGASTSALQTTGNTSLNNIDIKFPSPVSGRIPVDSSGVTQPVSATSLPLPTGASTSALQTTGNTSLNNIDIKLPVLGQKVLASSVSVVLASDQVLPLPTGASTSILQTTGNTSLASIDTKFNNVGLIADTSATTDTGSFSIIALIKRGLENWTTLQNKIPSLTSGRIPVQVSIPQVSSVTIISAIPTGNSFVLYPSQVCSALDINNNSGATIEVQRLGAGETISLLSGQSRLFIAISNANQIGIRRIDQATSTVKVEAEAITI